MISFGYGKRLKTTEEIEQLIDNIKSEYLTIESKEKLKQRIINGKQIELTKLEKEYFYAIIPMVLLKRKGGNKTGK